jgi:hypothetical protein
MRPDDAASQLATAQSVHKEAAKKEGVFRRPALASLRFVAPNSGKGLRPLHS